MQFYLSIYVFAYVHVFKHDEEATIILPFEKTGGLVESFVVL